jgi:flagellar hook-basal body complex protein FliE
MKTKREIYQKKLEAELGKWGLNIDKFKTQAAKTKSAARESLKERIKDLRAKHKTAEEKLKKLHASGDSAWSELKDGMEKAVVELRTSVRSALSKFK